MNSEEGIYIKEFNKYLADDPEMATAVALVKTLTGVITRSDASTMMELEKALRAAAASLKSSYEESSAGFSSISLTAGSELFLRYVTRCFLEFDDFEQCKAQLISRGELFAQTSLCSRNKICEHGHHFVRDGMVVLTHGFSRVVLSLLTKAAKTKHFSVIVTEGRPEVVGYKAADLLADVGIPTTVIVDGAIGLALEKADIVIVGAEGVVENGGIVNKIGTFTCAMAAKQMNKPFYVAAESFKFARLYPLNQSDLPQSKYVQKVESCVCTKLSSKKLVKIESPPCDYTPPHYITLLFTDLGVLTPSAVSDELIKLYQ